MRILLLGANGQLGTDLRRVLPARGHAVQPMTHAELEVRDASAVMARVAELRPDAVINTAAFHQVEVCETDPDRAFAVNAIGARNVASACAARDVLAVFFSTDYVFDGSRRQPWRESDRPAPLNVYGASKAAGEMLVAAACQRHLVLRVSGLFGVAGSSGKGGNFVETMLRKAASGQPLRVVHDQILTPTYTGHLAAAVADLLTSGSHGLYHLSAAGECSWHDFAAAIFRLQGVRADLVPVATSEFPSPVRRPPYSVLDKGKYLALGLSPVPSWEDGLREYLAARKQA